MLFFKKKKKEVDSAAAHLEANDEDYDPNAEPDVPVASDQAPAATASGDVSMGRLTADVEKLKAQFSTFYELQKASNERFGNITEQIGELRSMIIESDKSSQRVEAKATQAVDLVQTVQPDKFMVDIRKMDSKIEAIKANIESNENIQRNTINELKDMRTKMTVFKGMEQVIKMNEDSKNELMEIKRVSAMVERHADKVETIFSEMQKKFSDFIRVIDMVKDLDKSFKEISSDFDTIKVKMNDFGSKKEFENLISKFDDFEKYVGNVVTLLNKRFEKLQFELNDAIKQKFDATDKLLLGFQTLAAKTPDLDKYFNLLSEEAKKQAESKKKEEPEKIKELGAEEKLDVPEKESVLSKVGSAVSEVKEKLARVTEKK